MSSEEGGYRENATGILDPLLSRRIHRIYIFITLFAF